MASFPNSPLFKYASDEIRRAATRSFHRSDFGQLINEAHRAAAAPSHAKKRVEAVFSKYKSFTPERALRQLMGGDFGALVSTVHKYSKASSSGGGGGMWKKIVDQFLTSLGPSGQLLKTLANISGGHATVNSNLRAAIGQSCVVLWPRCPPGSS